MSHTPLHLVWEGKASVYVFFILSGLVLAKQVMKHRTFDWWAYYPQRMARLYLPVWAAVIFTVATFYLAPRIATPASLWLDERPETVTAVAFMKDVTLLAGNGGLASPLWSLRYEVLFSLTLPLYMWASRALPKLTIAKVVGCLAISTLGGYIGATMLIYIPMFLLGTMIVTERRRFDAAANYIGSRRYGWPSVAIVALVLMSSSGIVGGLGVSEAVQGAMTGPTTLGAGLIVLTSTNWKPAVHMLTHPGVQWLGLISFSLYLIHEPIVVAFGFLLAGMPPIVPVLAAIAVSLLLGWLFYKFVEKPCHLLSRKLIRKG